MDDLTPDGPDSGRLVGWKAIAGYMKVSQRTAIRWAEGYGLPVTRVRRGDRPLVCANPVDLEKWWQSAAARESLDHDARRESHEVLGRPPDRLGGVDGAESQVLSSADIGRWWNSVSRAGSLRGLVLLGCLLAAAGGVVVWRTRAADALSAGSPSPTPIQRAHSGAASPALIELSAAPAGQNGFSMTVAEGEMARLETSDLNLGLQGKMVGQQLKVFVYRLRPVGAGESAEFVESRLLSPGDTLAPLRVDGAGCEVTWSGPIPSAVTAATLPRSQCCTVCAGLTGCGRNVSAPCGGCQGEVRFSGVRR